MRKDSTSQTNCVRVQYICIMLFKLLYRGFTRCPIKSGHIIWLLGEGSAYALCQGDILWRVHNLSQIYCITFGWKLGLFRLLHLNLGLFYAAGVLSLSVLVMGRGGFGVSPVTLFFCFILFQQGILECHAQSVVVVRAASYRFPTPRQECRDVPTGK